ncbi:MAG: hypothetical protein ACKVVT_11535 [Dehalococcoidia bacterium]
MTGKTELTICHFCGAAFRAPRDAERRWLESHVERAHRRSSRFGAIATYRAATSR